MKRYFYGNSIPGFLEDSTNEILGTLAQYNEFALEQTQRDAWSNQIQILKGSLNSYKGIILFEYSIPRMGRRIDTVLLIKNVIFVLEFKVGEKAFLLSALDQV